MPNDMPPGGNSYEQDKPRFVFIPDDEFELMEMYKVSRQTTEVLLTFDNEADATAFEKWLKSSDAPYHFDKWADQVHARR